MGARELEVGEGGLLKIETGEATGVRIRMGSLWLAQRRDPSLLELYRADPIGVRRQLERDARAARSEDVHAFFAAMGRAVRNVIRRALQRQGR